MSNPESFKSERGRYIVIEGVDGAGKTTQVERLVRRLGDIGIQATRDIREPGGTEVGERIREILKNPGYNPLNVVTTFMLFSAARADLLSSVKGHLAEGEWVVTDRNHLSSFAYQVRGEGMPEHFYENISNALERIAKPDITLILIVGKDELLRRKRAVTEKDYFESRSPDFQDRVYEAYLVSGNLAGQELVDGEPPEEEVTDSIWEYIEYVSARNYVTPREHPGNRIVIPGLNLTVNNLLLEKYDRWANVSYSQLIEQAQ